jgi:hypothetical protein
MQVAALQLFLRSLVPALEAAGESRSAARWLDEACRVLEPFRAIGLAEFAAFLGKAAEFERTGSVQVPASADLKADALLAAVRRLTNANDLEGAQAQVADAINALANSSGLKGSVTPDPKWAAAQMARARVAPHLQAIRDLAGRITSPESYADESIRAEIARLEPVLSGDTLKAVGTEFGVSATAKIAPAKVLAAVFEKLSGHKPAKAKRGAKAPPEPADPAVVEENVRRLAALVDRSADPDAVSEADVEAELARLKALLKPALFEVVTRAGVEGIKPRDGVAPILTRVRNRLTAARRARERAEV